MILLRKADGGPILRRTRRIRWIMAGPAMLTLAAGLLAGPAGVARAASVQLTGDDNVVVDTVHGMYLPAPSSRGRGRVPTRWWWPT
jgi:hypothetical protein